jgi:hypothetical protein
MRERRPCGRRMNNRHETDIPVDVNFWRIPADTSFADV